MAFKTLPGDVLSFKLTHMFISHMVAEKSIFENLTFFWFVGHFQLYFTVFLHEICLFEPKMLLLKATVDANQKNDMHLIAGQVLSIKAWVFWRSSVWSTLVD